MSSALFLMAGIAVAMLLGAKSQSRQFKALIAKKAPPTQYLPKAVSMALVAAQISELLKMIEHVTIVNVAAALLLFAIVMATRSGTEAELH